jgi:hypothetical protein
MKELLELEVSKVAFSVPYLCDLFESGASGCPLKVWLLAEFG